MVLLYFFFFQAEDGIRDSSVTGVQTCALPISKDNIDELTTAYDAGVFRVVHLTSTDSDRKGTKALLRAWKAALEAGQLPPHAFLCIVATVHSRIRWWVSDIELGPN